MARPMQDVRVHNIQDRRSTKYAKKPWIVRITVEGREKGKAFRTRAEADRYRMLLLRAVEDGERFDVLLGEPMSWQPSLRDKPIHEWARDWVAGEWPEWQPRTRASNLEGLSRFVPLVVRSDDVAPVVLRRYLQTTLAPGTEDLRDSQLEAWLERHCLPLVDLDRIVLGRVDDRLGLKLDGSFLAPSTARRFRVIARACVRGAVDAGALPTDPWPTRSRNRAQRKVSRSRSAVNIRMLPGPDAMARAIAAIETHQPGSATYRVMTAVAYYAGLRPSEVVMLRLRALDLEGPWGTIEVAEADVSYDEPGMPKTGTRLVPIPPVLVEILRGWIAKNEFTDPSQLLFRTRTGRRPTPSNWSRAWRRALEAVGERPMRVYDCRHAAATTWLQAGVPLGETARRLGHSVETLVSTYVGALDGDIQIANARIEAILAPAEPTD